MSVKTATSVQILDLLAKRPDLSVADVEKLLAKPYTIKSSFLHRLWVFFFGGCAHEWGRWAEWHNNNNGAVWQQRECVNCGLRQKV